MSDARDRSCVGCKFLYSYGEGYSNYTWENNQMCCALDRNPHLPAEEPCDWNHRATWRPETTPPADNWPATQASRCERFAPGPRVRLDVDGDDSPSEHTKDIEQIVAIALHSGRMGKTIKDPLTPSPALPPLLRATIPTS